MDNAYSFPNDIKTPSEYANKIGQWYASQRSQEYKKRCGQYFTPLKVAVFMAKLVTSAEKRISIADPGAGTGILGCSLVEYLANTNNNLKEIELITYEIDKEIIPYLKKSLIYTEKWLRERMIKLKWEIISEDFILSHTKSLNSIPSLFPEEDNTHAFDYIISNPPYFKLTKSDIRVKAASWVVNGQPNIYALFMAVAGTILKPNGELVFITPRSYTAGPYFRLFREKFFSMVKPTYIHLFGSRKDTFNKDEVLQENVILKAKKNNIVNDKTKVIISFSNGIHDLNNCLIKEVLSKEVIDLNSRNRILRIPVTGKDDESIKRVSSWKFNLYALGMNISTGPVVHFRAKEYITDKNNNGTDYVPLFWMQNIKPMDVIWPAKNNKHQLIENNERTKKLLVPNQNYILLRRFSAKEEVKRLVVAPYLSNTIQSDKLGLENHLNYIYRPKGVLSPEEVFGLSALLNSNLLEVYFRTSNGNTQVSATELKDMPLPALQIIKKIGQEIISTKIANEKIDELVEKALA